MKSIPLLLFLLSLSIHPGLAADNEKPEPDAPSASPAASVKLESVRVRFVPGSLPMKGEASYEGASWTALVPGPQRGVLWLQAHAGIGDKFPVQSQAGETLFEVLLVKGNDDHVVLEVRSKEDSQSIDLVRDRVKSLKVGEIEYEFDYPSIYIGAAKNEKPTTPKAMLMVTRRL